MNRKSVVLLLVILLGFSTERAVAAISETEILGAVSATIINVSAPSSVFFSINPNAPEGEISFASSAVQIINNTNAPIEVKIAKGDSNFTLKPDSPWKPVNTSPDAHNWKTLGLAESESYIALGIQASPDKWKTLFRTEPLYIREQNSSEEDIVFGEMYNNSDITMSIVGRHGFAFEDKKECVFRVVWTFNLGN